MKRLVSIFGAVLPRTYKAPAKNFSARAEIPWERYEKWFLEIGAGVGYHALRLAESYPEAGIIAVEKSRERFGKFQRRLEKHPAINNLFIFNDDASSWMHQNISQEKLDKVYLLYPNPNPKNKAKRWVRMPFFEHLKNSLKSGAELYMASNKKFYIDEARDCLDRVWGMEEKSFIEFNAQNCRWQPRTHFEKKYLLRGENCFDLVVRR